MTRDRIRPAVFMALVALAVIAPAAAAEAHAAFVSSRPEPGDELGSAPGNVLLRFSEPLNLKLSRATVVDPTGKEFGTTAISDREMSVSLRTNAPGTYEVRWVTVSPLDGHTLRGSFRFGVGAPPQGGGAATSPGPSRADLVLSIVRAAEYAALLGGAGMLLLIALSRRRPPLDWIAPPTRSAFGLALAAGAAIIAGEATSAAGGFSPDALTSYLTTGSPGASRLLRVGTEATAFAIVLGAPRARAALAAAPAAVALVALASSGHAAAVRPAWWGIAIDTIHLGSAALWAGGILAMATLRPPAGWRHEDGQKLLDRFTPVALNAFALTVGTGILRASQELDSALDFVRSPYGRVLAAKIVGVAVMAVLSVRAWRRIAGSMRGEALVAGVVIVAAGLLAAYPLPPRRAAEAEELEEGAVASKEAIPRPGDVTLGGDAGETLVGLSLRPGELGRNEVVIFVLPLGGPEGAEGIRVDVAVDGRERRARECGATCRTVTLDMSGGERVAVRIGGEGGGTASFDVPSLPAPDGSELLRAANERMQRLETLSVDESLGPADPLVRTRYDFRAPDRMRLRSSNGFETVNIGATQYQRYRSARTWKTTSTPGIDAPLLTWAGFTPIGTRVVGADSIGGVRTTVVSFFTGDVENPIWFRLWVDAERTVRRMSMRAQGHFMEQRLFGFDEPLTIEPPVGERNR